MVRIVLILFLVLLVLVWLLRPSGQPASGKTASWLKAGGLLGVLIIVSRLTGMPLARLLRLLPFVLGSFKSAARAQEQYQQQHPQTQQGMSRQEARLILGVSEKADTDDITKAHRKLIAQHHPDKGGSDYLAAKINEARDVLLK